MDPKHSVIKGLPCIFLYAEREDTQNTSQRIVSCEKLLHDQATESYLCTQSGNCHNCDLLCVLDKTNFQKSLITF